MYLDRRKTRDLLLEYDPAIMPLKPRQAGLSIIYPWENQSMTVFAKQLFQFAADSGFDGDENDFITNFGKFLSSKSVIYANFTDFPEEGEAAKLYFALDEKILYYWDNMEYKPVKATLIDNTIIYSGDASEYYDA